MTIGICQFIKMRNDKNWLLMFEWETTKREWQIDSSENENEIFPKVWEIRHQTSLVTVIKPWPTRFPRPKSIYVSVRAT